MTTSSHKVTIDASKDKIFKAITTEGNGSVSDNATNQELAPSLRHPASNF